MPLFWRKRKKKGETASPEAIVAAAVSAALQAMPHRRGDYRVLQAEDARVPILGEPGMSCGALAFRGSNVPVAAAALAAEPEGKACERSEASALLKEALRALGQEHTGALCEIDLSGQSYADAFLWQTLELKSIALSRHGGAAEAWLWIESEAWDAFKASIGAETDDKAKHGAKTEEAALPSYRAERPADLAFLEAFAASEFSAASHSFHVDYHSFAFAKGAQAVADLGLPAEAAFSWFKASFERQNASGAAPAEAVSFLYALESSGEQGPDQAKAIIAALFSESVKRFLAMSGSKPGRLGLVPLPHAPDLSASGGLLAVSFRLRVASERLPGAVICPWHACAELAREASSPSDPSDMASSFFAWNTDALALALGEKLAAPEEPSLNGVLRLLSDKDYALILQNRLVPDHGVKGIPALLSYNELAVGRDGQPREIALPFGPLDHWRLESFLPEATREDFRHQARSMQGVTREGCAQANRAALRSLAHAVASGRLTASPRLALVLKRHFLDAERAEDEKKLRSMREAGIPFASLRALDERSAQRACGAISDRDLALAALDCESELPALSKLMSSTKLGRLREDLSFLKKALKAGKLEPSEMIRAKEAVVAVIEADKEREAKEKEKEKAEKAKKDAKPVHDQDGPRRAPRRKE
jgi:hypothetical protein